MTDKTIMAAWTVMPSAPPRPARHCPSCKKTTPFTSSGRVRLNANGKRLDAWLIYKCIHCDHTWNRPIVERQRVSQVGTADLDAMQQSTPDWIQEHEFDVAGLKAHSLPILHARYVRIHKKALSGAPSDWSDITLRLTPTMPTGVRLDRILCEGWQISRSQLQSLHKAGNVLLLQTSKGALRKPLQAEVLIQMRSTGLSDDMRLKLFEGLTKP